MTCMWGISDPFGVIFELVEVIGEPRWDLGLTTAEEAT